MATTNTSPPRTSPEISSTPGGLFQSLAGQNDPPSASNTDPNAPNSADTNRIRGQSSTSTLQGRLRSASKKFEESNPPAGFMIASAQIGSSIPTLTDIRRGGYGDEGWSAEGQVIEKERRASLARRRSSQTSEDLSRAKNSAATSNFQTINPSDEPLNNGIPESVEEKLPLNDTTPGVDMSAAVKSTTTPNTRTDARTLELGNGQASSEKRTSNDTNMTPSSVVAKPAAEYRTTPFDNGYQFPPKRKWTKSTAIFFKAFWKFFLTPIGFLVVVYGLNVIAWGGMLFLLLCNASPAMCHPTCNDINSPRRIWIETDCQIVNALFCVTGFGTIPWRFRDLYYLLQYRIRNNQLALRRLAGINRGWFRLEGSEKLPVNFGPAEAVTNSTGAQVSEAYIPFPVTKSPKAPLTGTRAPPTALWKLDFVIWSMVWNTFLQGVLSGLMWGYNRYQRPSWSTGLFVALACIVAGCGGIMTFVEGKKVKGIEGIPLTEEDKEILERDRELGITHYNNINDEGPKEKKSQRNK